MHLGDQPASRRIGGLELLVLGGSQVAPQLFNGGAELNEDVVARGLSSSRSGRVSKVCPSTSSARASPHFAR